MRRRPRSSLSYRCWRRCIPTAAPLPGTGYGGSATHHGLFDELGVDRAGHAARHVSAVADAEHGIPPHRLHTDDSMFASIALWALPFVTAAMVSLAIILVCAVGAFLLSLTVLQRRVYIHVGQSRQNRPTNHVIHAERDNHALYTQLNQALTIAERYSHDFDLECSPTDEMWLAAVAFPPHGAYATQISMRCSICVSTRLSAMRIV